MYCSYYWTFEIDTAELIKIGDTVFDTYQFEIRVNYKHRLAKVDQQEILLYSLGTGRYAEGWRPPVAGDNFSGKPYVDTYITCLFPLSYQAVDYFPKQLAEGDIQLKEFLMQIEFYQENRKMPNI